MNKYIVSLKDIYKKYDSTGVIACNGVSLDVKEGEIFAITGENGAGKSTLVKIIYGMEKPDRGYIELFGSSIDIQKSSINNKIGMVDQRDRIIRELTVFDNIILGNEPKIFSTFIDFKKAKKIIENIIEKYNFNIDINTKTKYLNINQVKQTAILKTLYQRSKLIILDEPTSSMALDDAITLYETIKSLKAEGITVIIITHRLKEIMSIADRIAVMRKGNVENIYDPANSDEIINDISGNEHITHKNITINEKRKTILKFDNVSFTKDMENKVKLNNISFEVHEGEIVAVTAIEGNGLREIEDIISGFIKPNAGKIYYKDKDITSYSTFRLRKNEGLSYIPSKRDSRGVCMNATVLDNIIINKRRAFSSIGILNKNNIIDYANMLLEYMNIKATYKQILKTLSGGNIQRLIIARELKQIKDYIICAEPTQGVDRKSYDDIHKQIMKFKSSSIAILLISSDINEILKLSDKIIILYRGSIIKTLENNGDIDEKIISKYMTGMTYA